MEILRKHNTSATIYFPMVKVGSQDFAIATDWTPVAADTKVSIDGGAFANTTNLPVHEGQGIWSLVLEPAEMNGAIISVVVVDAITKTVEDQALIVATYGSASGQYDWDLDDINYFGDALLRRDVDQVEVAAAKHSLATAVLKAVSRIRNNAGVLEIYLTDGSTIKLSQTITTDPTNDPIDEVAVGT